MLPRRTVQTLCGVSSSSGAVSRTSGGILLSRRCFVKVGDVVPITFIKGEKPPVIKEDKEYPDWVFKLGVKGPTKAELMAKFGENGEGVEQMTHDEKVRLKRMLAAEHIRTKNAINKKAK